MDKTDARCSFPTCSVAGVQGGFFSAFSGIFSHEIKAFSSNFPFSASYPLPSPILCTIERDEMAVFSNMSRRPSLRVGAWLRKLAGSGRSRPARQTRLLGCACSSPQINSGRGACKIGGRRPLAFSLAGCDLVSGQPFSCIWGRLAHGDRYESMRSRTLSPTFVPAGRMDCTGTQDPSPTILAGSTDGTSAMSLGRWAVVGEA